MVLDRYSLCQKSVMRVEPVEFAFTRPVFHGRDPRRRRQVVRQGSAKPSSRVRFPPSPQFRGNREIPKRKAEVLKTLVLTPIPIAERTAWPGHGSASRRHGSEGQRFLDS